MLFTKGCVRSPPPSQQEQHMDDVFSATCVGSCGAVVHKCARFGFGCARCAHVCRMS